MIFVCVGTQKQPFKRFFDMVEQINTTDEIIIQRGYNNIDSKNFNYDFSSTFESDIKKADIIITHGGVGSIMEGLLNNKKVIIIPRLKKYGEHVDDHQLEISNKFKKKNYCYIAENLEELQLIIDENQNNKLIPYPFENKKFNFELNKIIDDLIE